MSPPPGKRAHLQARAALAVLPRWTRPAKRRRRILIAVHVDDVDVWQAWTASDEREEESQNVRALGPRLRDVQHLHVQAPVDHLSAPPTRDGQHLRSDRACPPLGTVRVGREDRSLLPAP